MGVEIKDCGSETLTQVEQSPSAPLEYLYFTPNALMDSPSSAFSRDGSCSASIDSWQSISASALIAGGSFTEESMVPIDPRPACGSAAYSDIDAVPSTTFYTTTNYKGAFGSQNWLDGWSILNLPSRGGFAGGARDCAAATNDPIALCGDITSDMSLVNGPLYVMTCQVFVKSGVTLRIDAGVTIYATPTSEQGVAPALIVEQGGMLVADGTEQSPITFTALNPEVTSDTSVVTDTTKPKITSGGPAERRSSDPYMPPDTQKNPITTRLHVPTRRRSDSAVEDAVWRSGALRPGEAADGHIACVSVV